MLHLVVVLVVVPVVVPVIVAIVAFVEEQGFVQDFSCIVLPRFVRWIANSSITSVNNMDFDLKEPFFYYYYATFNFSNIRNKNAKKQGYVRLTNDGSSLYKI